MLPLDIHLQDGGRSGDREIWRKIKETIPKRSAHTYHVLSICLSLGATANNVPKLQQAKNKHTQNSKLDNSLKNAKISFTLKISEVVVHLHNGSIYKVCRFNSANCS